MRSNGYTSLALEYYDAFLHPTCANFDELSRRYLRPQISEHLAKSKAVLEVGAGRSVVADLLSDHASTELILLDLSEEMLDNSRLWENVATFVVADARATGLPSANFDLIVSSLGDPYNTQDFWFEVGRLLKVDGICLFTTPAPEWALSFRGATHVQEAEFVNSDGKTIFVPSFVPTFGEQIRMIEQAGLSIEDATDFRVADISGIVSPKLRTDSEGQPVILRGFQIRKTGP